LKCIQDIHERIREANVSHGQCTETAEYGWRKRRHGAQKKLRKKKKTKKTNMGGGQADILLYSDRSDGCEQASRERREA
jgi:hypothetical protein